MFNRIGASAYKANLDNTVAIAKILDNPENNFKTIHIAGTNGKGSVSHMLAAILQTAGYKVGLYTSPHLKDFRERIKINGEMISKNYITEFVGNYKNEFDKIQPSFFEWTVGLAFDYFSKKKVDIAIIETGLGGRLDSTNIIKPLISIITNISYDHQNLLGNTLKKIAFEKAGIIKKNGIAIISEKQKEIRQVFTAKAKKEKALLLFTEDYIKKIGYIECELKGIYQQKNIPTVILASEILNHLDFKICVKDIVKGLKKVCSITGFRGRWETLSKNPLAIADIAHNESGIKEVIKQVLKIPHTHLYIVYGTVKDKDFEKVISLLPKKATYYFCKAAIPRALDLETLAQKAKQYKLNGQTYTSVKHAIQAAKNQSATNDLILITGSAFVVAEVLL